MRPLSEFRAEVRRAALIGGFPPLTDERRAEIRAAVIANIGKPPSQEAFDVVEAGIGDTVESVTNEGGG